MQEAQTLWPALHLEVDSQSIYCIKGNVDFSYHWKDGSYTDEYAVRIEIPYDYPESPPRVWEVGGRIAQSFHRFVSGSLCLGAPVGVALRFAQMPTIRAFIERQLVPYLFSHTIYEDTGTMPFGELPHGGEGLLEFYIEYFGMNASVPYAQSRAVLAFLGMLANGRFAADAMCPCESGRPIGDCHGLHLARLTSHASQAMFAADLESIIYFLIRIPLDPPPVILQMPLLLAELTRPSGLSSSSHPARSGFDLRSPSAHPEPSSPGSTSSALA